MSVVNTTAPVTSIPLLTFGLLSSCLHLPVLPSSLSALPLSADLGALAVTQSCAYGPGFMLPKYEPHLAAVRQFASQLTALLATTAPKPLNSTMAIALPTTVPQTLPLWMGLGLFVLILFQFVLMVLFALSEASALMPSLAATPQSAVDAADALKMPAVTRFALAMQRGLTPLLMPATALLIALSIGVNTKFPTTALPAVLVLARAPAIGSNTSKLWLCVMAEAAIWFISRSRLRRQVALERAKTAVWKQITASGLVLVPASEARDEKTVAIDIPAPIYSPKPPTHMPATTLPSTGDDQSLSWRLVGDTSGKLYN